ncbi:MAG: DUF4864 domain-containing protein [Acidobacteria bacterium]|nr:DUF4864 domain-containing protein [Acidobacteriota bacterium]
MNESSPVSPYDPRPDLDAPDPREEFARRARQQSLRRLKRLLIFGCALFTLIIWLLVRLESTGGLSAFAPGPSRIVRQHLEALNRGAFREAYLLFSQHYRDEVSFELYHELVVTHAAMFRTRIVSFSSRQLAGQRIVLDTRLVASDGERYVARFTLIQVENRWWIDDLRWAADSGRRYTITT